MLVFPEFRRYQRPVLTSHAHDLVIISSTVSSNNVSEELGVGYRDRGVPFITWENEGGAFVLVYLLCIAAVGLPIIGSDAKREISKPGGSCINFIESAGDNGF